MNKMDQNADRLVDKALRDYPLEPVSGDLYSKVMEGINQPQTRKGWYISWMDLVFSGVLALNIGFFLDLIQKISRSPYWSARIKVEITLIWQSIKIAFLQHHTEILTGLISGLTLVILGIILGSVYRRQLIFAGSTMA